MKFIIQLEARLQSNTGNTCFDGVHTFQCNSDKTTLSGLALADIAYLTKKISPGSPALSTQHKK